MKQENLRGVSMLELSTSSSGVLVASASDDIVTVSCWILLMNGGF